MKNEIGRVTVFDNGLRMGIFRKYRQVRGAAIEPHHEGRRRRVPQWTSAAS
jgi:hypothetical protein